jgi:tetratricopeptide (TPR) repeat protein
MIIRLVLLIMSILFITGFGGGCVALLCTAKVVNAVHKANEDQQARERSENKKNDFGSFSEEETQWVQNGRANADTLRMLHRLTSSQLSVRLGSRPLDDLSNEEILEVRHRRQIAGNKATKSPTKSNAAQAPPGNAGAGQSEKRQEAMDLLWRGYSLMRTGDDKGSRDAVDQALALDPDLAYANIVRGELAMKDGRWQTARTYFEKGLGLLGQPGQPLSPSKGVTITVEEVEGDARCFLGYVYIKCAQEAQQAGSEDQEQVYLARANEALNAGLALKPGDEARDMAKKLLGMFR